MKARKDRKPNDTGDSVCLSVSHECVDLQGGGPPPSDQLTDEIRKI